MVPFFGLSTSYKNTFIIISGILLVLLSLNISIPKKNIRPKPKREKVTAVFSESIPPQPKISPIQMRQMKSKESID